MAALTQSVSGGSNSAGPTIATSTTFVATAGRVIFVSVSHELNVSTITVTDTAGNTYHPCTKRAHSDGDNWVQHFYAYNITGHATNTVTAHFTPDVQYTGIFAREYSGFASTDPFDTEIGAESSSAGTITSGSMTASGAGVIFVSAKAYNDDNWSLGTNMTDLVQVVSGGAFLHGCENRILTVGGSYTASITRGGSTDVLLAATIFKEAAGGGGSTNRKVFGIHSGTTVGNRLGIRHA